MIYPVHYDVGYVLTLWM